MTKIKTVNGVKVLPYDRRHFCGTSLMGYIYITGNELKKVLGTPNRDRSGDGKTRVEWRALLNGKVVTFYDYKEPRAPKMADVFEWHIGGASNTVIAIVNQLFPDHTARGWR